MSIIEEDDIDIKLDINGQPVPSKSGDFDVVEGDECWKQDIKNEAATEEKELFYEDEDGDEAYGFGMTDFMHAEDDEFTRTEITQRVIGKLSKRTYLDRAKTFQNITFKNGTYTDKVTVSKNNSKDEYNLELSTNDVEVVSE